MAAVNDPAGVEMKEEERSRWSSHPHGWSVGGACNKAILHIQQPKHSRTRRPQATDALTLEPSATWRRRKELQTEKRARQIWEGKNKIDYLCFSPFAGNDGPHSQQGREGKKKAGLIHPFPGIVSTDAWTHVPPVAVARGEDASPLFRWPNGFTTLFLWLRATGIIHDFSSSSFCKFKLCNVLFGLFLTLIIL